VGATEAALQGPFLVATAAPGVIAAILAIMGTLTVADWLSRLTAALALPPVGVSPLILAGQAAVGILLPLAAAMITLARHAVVELES
jgi:hypothetical protein